MSTPTPPSSDPFHRPEDPAAGSGGTDPGPSSTDPTAAPSSPATPPTAWSQPYAPVPPTTFTPAAEPAPRRRRGRKALALVAAGGLLAGVVGLSASYASGTLAADNSADTQTSNYGQGSTDPGSSGQGSSDGNGYGDRGQAPDSGSGSAGRYGSGQDQTSTVDSDPATATEGKGVALIDTVLTNGEAAGTGIVLTAAGEILTNYHVVEGSTAIRVTIAATGKTYTATVVGHDQAADVALLQLKGASGLAVAQVDDDTLALGDDVTAVGNAGGTGELTAADGTVTDLSTSITTQSEDSVRGEQLEGLIETSADVVAGDSGGPLLDDEGEVVGIDTAASSGQLINGYAIPIDDALAVVTQILTGTETSAVQIGPAAFLGVVLATTQTYGGMAAGATIAGTTSGGAAVGAGLAAGDTITGVGGTAVADSSELSAAIAAHDAGDEVKITWTTTDGSTDSATVTLGSSPVA